MFLIKWTVHMRDTTEFYIKNGSPYTDLGDYLGRHYKKPTVLLFPLGNQVLQDFFTIDTFSKIYRAIKIFLSKYNVPQWGFQYF